MDQLEAHGLSAREQLLRQWPLIETPEDSGVLKAREGSQETEKRADYGD